MSNERGIPLPRDYRKLNLDFSDHIFFFLAVWSTLCSHLPTTGDFGSLIDHFFRVLTPNKKGSSPEVMECSVFLSGLRFFFVWRTARRVFPNTSWRRRWTPVEHGALTAKSFRGERGGFPNNCTLAGKPCDMAAGGGGCTLFSPLPLVYRSLSCVSDFTYPVLLERPLLTFLLRRGRQCVARRSPVTYYTTDYDRNPMSGNDSFLQLMQAFPPLKQLL